MTVRRPLVLIDGALSQLPAGDVLEMETPLGHGCFLGAMDVSLQVAGKTYLRSGKTVHKSIATGSFPSELVRHPGPSPQLLASTPNLVWTVCGVSVFIVNSATLGIYIVDTEEYFEISTGLPVATETCVLRAVYVNPGIAFTSTMPIQRIEILLSAGSLGAPLYVLDVCTSTKTSKSFEIISGHPLFGTSPSKASNQQLSSVLLIADQATSKLYRFASSMITGTPITLALGDTGYFGYTLALMETGSTPYCLLLTNYVLTGSCSYRWLTMGGAITGTPGTISGITVVTPPEAGSLVFGSLCVQALNGSYAPVLISISAPLAVPVVLAIPNVNGAWAKSIVEMHASGLKLMPGYVAGTFSPLLVCFESDSVGIRAVHTSTNQGSSWSNVSTTWLANLPAGETVATVETQQLTRRFHTSDSLVFMIRKLSTSASWLLVWNVRTGVFELISQVPLLKKQASFKIVELGLAELDIRSIQHEGALASSLGLYKYNQIGIPEYSPGLYCRIA